MPHELPDGTSRATFLADEATRRRLVAFVRGRVPSQDAEDVVQAVLCDALASDVAPDDPGDLARWLAGVARHKAADLHRERARRPGAEAAEVDAIAVPPPDHEARSLLRAVVAGAARDARGAQALEWAVREADGERLDHMAQEASLEPAAVRQRVSRLRRVLRRRWLRQLLLVAAAMTAILATRAAFVHQVAAPIVAEPTGRDGEIFAAFQGEWRVESVEPADVRAAGLLGVRVHGSRVSFVSPVKEVERGFRIEHVSGGRCTLRIDDGHGGVVRAEASFDGPDRVLLRSDDPSWRGAAVLAR